MLPQRPAHKRMEHFGNWFGRRPHVRSVSSRLMIFLNKQQQQQQQYQKMDECSVLELIGEVFFSIAAYIDKQTPHQLYAIYEESSPFNLFIGFVDPRKKSTDEVWFRVVEGEPKLLFIATWRTGHTDDVPHTFELADPGFFDWLDEACKVASLIDLGD